MKLVKKLFIILIILIIISSAVFAETIAREITVYFRNIIIYVDGNEVVIDTEPFIYNNRVYVPIKFVNQALKGEVSWDNENSKVKIKSYQDFRECNYFDGEIFVYGLVTALDKKEKMITIEQHFDNNSMEVKPFLKIRDDVVIILQRNDKKINLDINDLKVGEDIGAVLDKDGSIRGIIISK